MEVRQVNTIRDLLENGTITMVWWKYFVLMCGSGFFGAMFRDISNRKREAAEAARKEKA
jgi:hypothetical protein